MYMFRHIGDRRVTQPGRKYRHYGSRRAD